MIFLASLLFSVHVSHAADFKFTYGEDDVWITDTVSIDSNGWPEIKKHEVSKSKPLIVQEKQLVPGAGTELRGLAGSTLWTVTEQWNWDWELRYTEWVKTTIDKTFWTKYGIATDCADVAISARWIFARIHGLPAANHLITGHWFTYRSVKPEWENLPTAPEWYNDQKFMAALDYLLSQAFTHTLLEDSYPVAIGAQSILPGGYHLHLFDDTGHTQFIYQVGTAPDQIPIVTLNSTTPREVRDLFEYVFFDRESHAPDWGFMRMRWPVWVDDVVSLVAPQDMPFYSEEQFDRRFIRGPRTEFWEEVFYRLNPQADLDVLLERSLVQVRDLFLARIPVVEKGWEICSQTPCFEGSLEWEAWSTPSRDQRIANSIGVFAALLDQVGGSIQIYSMLHSTVLTLDRNDYDLTDLIEVWDEKAYSSNPNDEIGVRWGVD
jgi:hypothetical protein